MFFKLKTHHRKKKGFFSFWLSLCLLSLLLCKEDLHAQESDFFKTPTLTSVTLELRLAQSFSVRLQGKELEALFSNETEETVVILLPQNGSYYKHILPYYQFKVLDITDRKRMEASLKRPIALSSRICADGDHVDPKETLTLLPKQSASLRLSQPLNLKVPGKYRFQLVYELPQGSYPRAENKDKSAPTDWPRGVFTGEIVSTLLDYPLFPLEAQSLPELMEEFFNPETDPFQKILILEQLKIFKEDRECLSNVIREALPVLIELLIDENAGRNTQTPTLQILAEFGESSAEVIPILIRMLPKKQVIQTLGKMGIHAKSVVPKLLEIVQDPPVLQDQETIVEEALLSLGYIQCYPDLVIPLLLKFVEENTQRELSIWVLGQFGKQALAGVPLLRKLLDPPHQIPSRFDEEEEHPILKRYENLNALIEEVLDQITEE
jgi:hypothetical protein